jgi:hypothetical protein
MAILFEAIENGDLKLFLETFVGPVTEQVNQLWPSNLFDTDYTWSLLHAACYYGNMRIIEVFFTLVD